MIKLLKWHAGKWTPLHAAIHANQSEFAYFLLEQGADPNAEMDTGWTPLHAAIKKNNMAIQQACIAKGANWSVPADHK